MKSQFVALMLFAAALPTCAQEKPQSVKLETLSLEGMFQGFGTPHRDRSVDGNSLMIAGKRFERGIGTHANSKWTLNLNGAAKRFTAIVGVDDEAKSDKSSLSFVVLLDKKKIFESGVMHMGDAPKTVDVDLTGGKVLTLLVTDGGDGISFDHGDWIEPTIELISGSTAKIEPFMPPVDPPRLTVPAKDPKPAIHGARVVGATPGKPFQFLIAATGDAPLTFSAKGLPAGITLDAKTGLLSGTALKGMRTEPGFVKNYTVEVSVKNALGTAKRKLRLVFGDQKLALTPPMGWNSWNCWAGAVDAQKIRISTDAMIASGLASHGFQYINIDDCWQGKRDANGEIQPNEKFGDMKVLADYVHAKGLKIGIYSSPGPKTCAGFEGSWLHEIQDAKTYASWGFDYLKHDWCSYGEIEKGNSLEAYQKPYLKMRAALRNSERDIVYSLCQYGMGDVWKWGADVDGNCWRTTGDIEDSWNSLYGIYSAQAGHERFSAPGRWNDPDMLIVGRVGWGNPHPSRLTPNEQILHISMWSLLASPLLIGCDMGKLDPFTVAILSNDEVLDINQDPLGKAAGRLKNEEGREVWVRPLYDGTRAVGLVNSGDEAQKIEVKWSELGLKNGQAVRDLWLHKSLGVLPEGVTIEVPSHGTVLLKVGNPQKNRYE